MRRILVTGMSGTGKSTALTELARRGFSVVETDHAPFSEWSEQAGGYVWNEKHIRGLLDREYKATLYVSGAVSNQALFYPHFDAVVLLSAPVDVLLHRIKYRTTNDFGKSDDERKRIVSDISYVEPLLRATCTHEIDTTQTIEVVLAELVAIGEGTESQERATKAVVAGMSPDGPARPA